MAEIFVSYARSTSKEAQAVAGGLRSLGWEVWLDDDLPAHRAFTEVIEEKLRAATAVVVVWSAEAVKSEWVQAEADLAREGHKLVQLTVDRSRLPLPFDRIQCADLSGWSGEADAPGWRKVLTSVRDLMGAPPAAPHVDAARAAEPRLAVLAFDNLSGDPEMAYFSDGMSEEILQTVARGAQVKVIGRGSSFQFRGADKAAAHVAAALEVTHVLDGSVRRSGTKVRIAANLIECAHQTTLWSDRFDRELSDVFALQDEIAAAVAAALKVAFAPPVQPEAVDPAAYTLYLKALAIRNRGIATAPNAVIDLLNEATRLAPRFARAWELLATVLAFALRFDYANQANAVTREDVVTAAQTALKLDPGLGGAYQALAELEAFGAFAAREAFHDRALAVAPSDPAVVYRASLFLTEVGRIREALGHIKQAYELDPMYPPAGSWYANLLDFAGRTEDSCALWDKLFALWPDNDLIAWNAIVAAANHGDWGRFDARVAGAGEGKLETPFLPVVISHGAALRDPTSTIPAQYLAEARVALTRTGTLPLNILGSLCQYGLRVEAFELMDRASFAYVFDPQQRSPNVGFNTGIIFCPVFNSELMGDVGFVRLCSKLGLCDYWLKSGKWPDCAEEGMLPYDFKAECRRLAGAAA